MHTKCQSVLTMATTQMAPDQDHGSICCSMKRPVVGQWLRLSPPATTVNPIFLNSI